MIPEDIQTEILRRLKNTEAEHGVRILFAIESGSRAWGFASPNSDFDVRFIYCHDALWYQSIDLEERRDVIEYPIVDDIDLNGWDVRKALRLFWKSNPAFVEWLLSPITYLEPSAFRAEARDLLTSLYDPEKGIHHYRSMAKANYRGFLREPMVKLKKYFYVLRPLLAMRWLSMTGEAAPIEFEKLLPMLNEESEVLEEIHRLLDLKRRTSELGLAPSIPVLNAFIEAELEKPIDVATKFSPQNPLCQLNAIFQLTLQEDF